MEPRVNRNLLSLFYSRSKLEPASVKVRDSVKFDCKFHEKHRKLKTNHRNSVSSTTLIQDRLKIVKKIQSIILSDQSLKKINYLGQYNPQKKTVFKPKLDKPNPKIRIVRVPRVSQIILAGKISAWD